MFSRTLARRAAIAAIVGISFAAVPAVASAAPAEGDPGSVLGIFDLSKLGGSVQGSLQNEDTGSISSESLGGLVNAGSLETGVEVSQGSTSGSAGSLGEAAGTLNAEAFGTLVGGSLESASAKDEDGNSSLSDPKVLGSVGDFFANLGVIAGQTQTP